MEIEVDQIKSELIIEDDEDVWSDTVHVQQESDVDRTLDLINELESSENGGTVTYENSHELTGSYSQANYIQISPKGADSLKFQEGKSTVKNPEINRRNKEKVSCSYCQKSFSNKYILKNHISIIHFGKRPEKISKERSLPCPQCNRMFSRPSFLNSHLQSHITEKKIYKCDICNKVYQSQSALKNHNVTHHGKKPFVCSICQKTFIHDALLEMHLQSHERENEREKKRKLKCEYCPKRFLRVTRLNVHRRIHTGMIIEILFWYLNH